LPQVQQIVPRVQAAQMLQALLSALDMHTDAFQLVWRGAHEQPQVRAAQHPELLERQIRIRLVVAKPLGPQVLVVTRQRRSVVRQNLTDAPARCNLGVGQVLQDLSDRPLAWPFCLAKLRCGKSVDRAREENRCLAKDRERVAVTEQIEYCSNVCGRMLGRARRGICVNRQK
jgi:hypothetical protein